VCACVRAVQWSAGKTNMSYTKDVSRVKRQWAIDGLRACWRTKADRQQPAYGERGWDLGTRVVGMGPGIGGVGGEKMAGRLTTVSAVHRRRSLGRRGWLAEGPHTVHVLAG